jgi:phosphate transport system permease protein
MNTDQWIRKTSKYIKNRRKENLVASALLVAVAVVILVYSLTSIYQIAISTRSTKDYGFSGALSENIEDISIGIFGMLPSVGFLCIAYLLLEDHSMGWKSCLVAGCVTVTLGLAGTLNFKVSSIIVLLTLLAAVVGFISRKKNLAKSDSPVITENIVKLGLTISGILCIGILVGMVAYVALRGAQYVNWDFITGKWEFLHAKQVLLGQQSGSIGGISAYIIGSLLLVTVCEAIAVPLGIGAGIYLSEYAGQGKFTNTIRFFIETLAGAPSILIGLVGLGLFVRQFGWGESLLAGGISLAIMILPWNIRVTEEAARSVPAAYREASFAMGASMSQTIRKVVLYAASPGIITGIILGIGAAIGETAVVIFTTQGITSHLTLSFTNAAVPALPIWIYSTPSQLGSAMIGTGMATPYDIAFAGALVLVAIFMVICIVGLVIRNYLSKKISGK